MKLEKFFFVQPKKMRIRPDNWSTKRLTKTTFSKKTGQKIQESEQKRSDTGQIFLWSTKKNEKQTGQLVDQETDQNHMDGTLVL